MLTYVLFSLLPWCFFQRICDSVWTRHMMSQLGLPPQPEIALPLIHQAARVDSVRVPQSAYIFSGNSPARQFPRILCAAYCAAPVGPTRSVSSFRACCIPLTTLDTCTSGRRPLRRPISPARQSTRQSLGRRGPQQVVFVRGRGTLDNLALRLPKSWGAPGLRWGIKRKWRRRPEGH